MRRQQIISTPKIDTVARLVADSDAALWTETFLRTELGLPFSFRDHVYQIEPLGTLCPNISVQKARQLGFTLLFMCKGLHGLATGRIPVGLVVVFPTDLKVTDFSETRWTPFLQKNAAFLSPLIQSTNNKRDKRVANANLMFRGGRLTQKIAGVAEDSAALRSDPQDGGIFDEYDLIDAGAVEIVKDGSLHSTLKLDWRLANPTVPEYGIDARFQEGDQRYWMIRCDACNAWWAEWIEIPQIMRRRADGSVYLGCLKCGRALDSNRGEWVAKHPQRTATHMSYRISQLARPQGDLRHLLDAYENPPDGDKAGVMRFKFGHAYIDAALALSVSDVLLCCTPEPMWNRSLSPTAIGVDVGPHQLHVVIGQRLAHDVYQIGALVLVSGWGPLLQVFAAFNCEVASIDNEPEVHAARTFQQQMTLAEVWLSDYVAGVRGAAYDHATGVIRVNRNEILDETHAKITTAGKLRLPAHNSMVQDFAEHCANVFKVVEAKPTGDAVVRYLKRSESRPDHWRHAFANFLLAAHRQVGRVVRGNKRQRQTNVQQRPTGGFDLFGGK